MDIERIEKWIMIPLLSSVLIGAITVIGLKLFGIVELFTFATPIFTVIVFYFVIITVIIALMYIKKLVESKRLLSIYVFSVVMLIILSFGIVG